MLKWQLKNEQQTLDFAAALGDLLVSPLVIYLHGELGAGKTCFSRGLINSFGHQGNVKSPTYTLVEQYQLKSHLIFHFDLYRLSDPEELEYLGIRDFLDSNAILLIEWAERGVGWLPQADLNISLKYQGDGREIVLAGESDKGSNVLQKIAGNLQFDNFSQI